MSESNQQNSTPSINVNQTSLSWELNEGRFQFEGQDALLFWIDSAMKSFFDTIEDVSGPDAASVVIETSGYRMGTIVSEFFHKSGDPLEVFKMLPNIYAAAGWGFAEIKELSTENKTAVIRLKESWEYKLNLKQGKTKCGTFLPAHWAGVLSGVLGENIWYTIKKSQLEGDEYDEVHLGKSPINPRQNIHALARKNEQEEIRKLETLVRQRTKELTDLVQELSSPMIPVMDDIVVIPLLGKYDDLRSKNLVEKITTHLPDHSPDYLIIDLTGIDEDIDAQFGELIYKIIHAVQLMGTYCILVGISPQLSIKITQTSNDLKDIDCFSTMKHGIHFALAQKGKQIL